MKEAPSLHVLLALLMASSPIVVFAEDDHNHSGKEELARLSDEAILSSKIEIRQVGPADLSMLLKVNGRVSPVSSAVAHISSRFSGVIREVRKEIGEEVRAGDVLAIVESNANLQKFEVRALQGGIVTDRHATIGESIKEDEALFVVMDLSRLWVEFAIFQRDVPVVKIGQPADIYVSGRSEPFRSRISFISPLVDETTQSRIARAVIDNPDNSVAPGAFVTGQISTAKFQVSLAVSYEGIQTIDGKTVIFVQKDDGFEKRGVSVGRSDGRNTEIISGAKSGEKYVSANSFILKAEFGKSEAGHEH